PRPSRGISRCAAGQWPVVGGGSPPSCRSEEVLRIMTQEEVLEGKLLHLPKGPGVYMMKGADGEVLYVGKAKSLRSRVRSYFGAAAGDSLKTRELVRRIRDIDTMVVGSEAEALILENNLIKEYRPRFNIN